MKRKVLTEQEYLNELNERLHMFYPGLPDFYVNEGGSFEIPNARNNVNVENQKYELISQKVSAEFKVAS